MRVAELPADERRRLAELYALGLLDSAAEASFDEITRLARRVFDVPIALVSLVDAHRQWFKSNDGLDAEETPRDVAFCAHTILDDDVLVVENATEDERFADNPLVVDDPTIRFYAGAPVHSPGGRRLGTLCVIDREPRTPTDDELESLRDLALLVDREIAQASNAVTDPLTGLYNRRGYLAAAQHLVAASDRTGAPLVLAYADVDGLKKVNDDLGHDAGDAVIKAAAGALRDALREADIVARLGGDEFAALLYGADEQSAAAPFERLRTAVATRARDADLPLSVSVGWVERSPGESIDALMTRADEEMYARKRS